MLVIRKFLHYSFELLLIFNISFSIFRVIVLNQLEKRIQLMGIFPGAEVIKGPFWPYGKEVIYVVI